MGDFFFLKINVFNLYDDGRLEVNHHRIDPGLHPTALNKAYFKSVVSPIFSK